MLTLGRTARVAPLRYRTPSCSCRPVVGALWPRRTNTSTAPTTSSENSPPTTLAVLSDPYFNKIGVQQLPDHIHRQLFPKRPEPPPHLVQISRDHLKLHELLGKNSDTSAPISFDLPKLQGKTMDEHFYKLGVEASEPYLTFAKQFATKQLPDSPNKLSQPLKWVENPGWTKYNADGTTESVEYPDEEMLVFDVEVLYKKSPFAVMACAASPDAWYSWLSPWLFGDESDRHLIPLGDPENHRIIIGHNVGYDRARIAEDYNIKQTKNSFIDTMSLHVAVNGMCSRQRPTWLKHAKNREKRENALAQTKSDELAKTLEHYEEEELWVGRSSINSLRDVAKFHCNTTIDKSVRDQFGELDRKGVVANLQTLLDYCAADVSVTHNVYKALLPRFLEVCPHPVSFAALRHLASVILPVNRSWETYIDNAEGEYRRLSEGVAMRLRELAEKALEVKDDPEIYRNDDWLKQLDWSGQEIRMTKGKKNEPPRPMKNQKMPGMPKWYKGLFAKASDPSNLTVRTRIAPLLLKLSWDGNPLVWSDKHGWIFRVDGSKANKYAESPAVKVSMSEETNLALRDDVFHTYFKLPHKNGPSARCASPLAKGYLQYFESGILTSEYDLAKEALEMNAACSYWISARERIKSQLVVYESDMSPKSESDQPPEAESNSSPQVTPDLTRKKKEEEIGFILPQIIPMGTVTRRAVESTWLTASNAKKNRVGSELKALVTAPPGYKLVGADVDSQELWIASLVGDAQFKLHGGNAIGFMTLEGSKANGTDMHSRTASILGISRNNAKVFNYGRIYGAGLKFATTLLRQFSPGISDAEASKIAAELYLTTKGQKTTRKTLSPNAFWRGGTESYVFNRLEAFAEQDDPRTPVLGAGITEALKRRYLSKGGFLTSRINWAIQSSGVDYLHLLIISMDYLIRTYSLDARLALTVHDEIRYLVKETDALKAAMALQVSNLWTRAMFSQQMGIDDVPQSCAWFSAVDIDHVLRKEVDLDCITPSHPEPIEPGVRMDINDLLDRTDAALLHPKPPGDYNKIPYKPRTPVMKDLETNNLMFLKAQMLSDDGKLEKLVNEVRMKMNGVGSRIFGKDWEPDYRATPIELPSVFESEADRIRDLKHKLKKQLSN